jgi:hypothetical protein
MNETELGFDGPQSHLSQPLAASFVHHRFGGAIRGLLGGGGLTGAIGGFIGGGGRTAPSTIPGPPVLGPAVPVSPGTPGTTFVGPAGVGIGGGPGGTQAGPCTWPQSWDPIRGKCVIDLDPGAGTGLPFMGPQVSPGGAVTNGAGQGIVFPIPTERLVQDCPTMPNGKKGILWMGAQDGVLVCLPRGVNGRPMGYVRKNKPRRKPFITAAQISELRRKSSLTKKAKEFAKLTGQTCKPRGRGR